MRWPGRPPGVLLACGLVRVTVGRHGSWDLGGLDGFPLASHYGGGRAQSALQEEQTLIERKFGVDDASSGSRQSIADSSRPLRDHESPPSKGGKKTAVAQQGDGGPRLGAKKDSKSKSGGGGGGETKPQQTKGIFGRFWSWLSGGGSGASAAAGSASGEHAEPRKNGGDEKTVTSREVKLISTHSSPKLISTQAGTEKSQISPAEAPAAGSSSDSGKDKVEKSTSKPEKAAGSSSEKGRETTAATEASGTVVGGARRGETETSPQNHGKGSPKSGKVAQPSSTNDSPSASASTNDSPLKKLEKGAGKAEGSKKQKDGASAADPPPEELVTSKETAEPTAADGPNGDIGGML